MTPVAVTNKPKRVPWLKRDGRLFSTRGKPRTIVSVSDPVSVQFI